MASALTAVLTLLTASAVSQTPATPPPAPADSPAQAAELEEVKKELEGAKRQIEEMREEFRAQMATQSVAQGWTEDWVEETRKLELFVVDGYFRIRPDLLYKMDLGRDPDPSGYTLFPVSPVSPRERTLAGVNMRFRFEPTLNVSEEVRIRMQVDALDNVLFGSTPDYAFSRSLLNNYRYDRDEFSVLSDSQSPPRSAINAISDSIMIKRVYGEVSTPVGILRFGRMGSHWGLGILRNDGNCLDCDHGDNVDRVMFVTEPFSGFYVTPMVDFNVEGPATTKAGGGPPIDLSQIDDAVSYVVAVARRDTEQQTKAKLDNNQAVFNYGLHFTYRHQARDASEFLAAQFTQEGGDLGPTLNGTFVPRDANLYIPDLWVKYERRDFRLELEVAGQFGAINNRAQLGANADAPGRNQRIELLQIGAAAQGEYRLLDGALQLGLEAGFASGDKAPGFGNYPRRRTGDPSGDNNTLPGDIDGPQYACQSTGGCSDGVIRNFRFNQDYRIDMILWREILGGITDAIYVRPSVNYRVAEGFNLWGAIIYSRAVYPESTPSATPTSSGSADLGVELNVGGRYETEDGFFAAAAWGILFPLGGLSDNRPAAQGRTLDTPQAVRGIIGIKY